MSRFGVVAAAVVASVVGGAATASAGPIVFPPSGQYTITLTALQTGCGDVVVAITDGRATRFHLESGPIRAMVSGSSSAKLTSVDSGRSVSVNLSGSTVLRPAEAYSITGGMLIVTDPGLYYAKGRFVADPAVSPRPTFNGTYRDLCSELNP